MFKLILILASTLSLPAFAKTYAFDCVQYNGAVALITFDEEDPMKSTYDYGGTGPELIWGFFKSYSKNGPTQFDYELNFNGNIVYINSYNLDTTGAESDYTLYGYSNCIRTISP